jgi:hypothetical protein
MTEQNLIDLGFERFDEIHCEHPFYYYVLTIGGIEFLSNADDEFKEDGIWVEILEADIRFHGVGDLQDIIKILELNQK